ncbi:MAG: hypothetical protein ABIO57_03500 [Candidatus Paceibacterota bacterium]
MNEKTTNKTSGWYIFTGIAIVIIGLIVWAYSNAHKAIAPVTDATQLPGIETGSAPWPAEFNHLKQRLSAIGLPALTAEGTALHIHQHLDMLIDGQVVPVPTHIGIDQADQFIATIHVHDTSGIVHVESPIVQTFTLGQFFDIWGLKFTTTSIGNYAVGNSKVLQLYVNGTLYQGDLREFVLAAHQELFLFYGTPDQLPKTIPATFAFPEGY